MAAKILKHVVGGPAVVLRVLQTDAAGNPISPALDFDAPPVWTGDAPGVATIAPAADGLSATVTPVKPGTETVSVAAEIGGQKLEQAYVVTVTAGAGTVKGLAIVADAPLTAAKPVAAAKPAASAAPAAAPAHAGAPTGLATGLRPAGAQVAPGAKPPVPAPVANRPTK